MAPLKVIASAWGKKIGILPISEEMREVAKKRVEICAGCTFAKEGWLTKFIDDVLKNDEIGSGIVCTKCGCPCQTKALELTEDCPMGYWPKIESNDFT